MENKHITFLKLDFPFIYAEFDEKEIYRYDISEMIKERKEYEKLKDIDFFNSAKLWGNDVIVWDDYIDIPTSTLYEFGEEVESF